MIIVHPYLSLKLAMGEMNALEIKKYQDNIPIGKNCSVITGKLITKFIFPKMVGLSS